MRRSELLALVGMLSACGIPLDKPPTTATTTDPPVLAGCLLFQAANSSIGLLQGAGTSVVLSEGAALWSFGGATISSTSNVSNGLLVRVAGDASSQCYPTTSVSTSASAFATSPLGSQYLIAPLDLVIVGSKVWSYYRLFSFDASAPLGVKAEGTGVAPYDEASGQFVPTPSLLWAGDAPDFGEAAVVDGSEVYVYACNSNANGDPVCYGAHVDGSQIDRPDAYEFAQGGGFYTSDFEQALPIIDGPSGLSIRRHRSGRWLATYVRPLESIVMVRSALSPMGPFSKEHALFTCEKGANDFCAGGVQHPEADPDVGTIAVSYVAATFSAEGVGDEYWPHLAFVALPDALP